MTEDDLRRILREELAPLSERLARVEARVDGLPLWGRTIMSVQQDVRMLRTAFNDFARTNPTSGEIQALHDDVNRVQAEYMELATKVATLERLLAEK